MEFEQVRDIIVETLAATRSRSQWTPPWLTIWVLIPWLPWNW